MSTLSQPAERMVARYAVLVPVKPPVLAKSRLGGLGDRLRVDLAQAFASDTVAAARACPSVSRVLVVTDDHLLAGRLREQGADVIPDGASDLNATLVQAAAEVHRRDPSLHLVALCADLPALRPAELARALEATDPVRMSFVSDQEGTGTTTVVAPTLDAFRPSFGPGSRLHHLAADAHEVDVADVPGLRRDVDEPDDLVEAIRLGVGPRTASVTETLRW
jgi:2-phospho-L-lactate guanylyltransferase